MASNYTITRDPLYFVMVAVFAVLTTALPTGLGQYRLLPMMQTVVLTLFAGLAIRRGQMQSAQRVMAIWLTVQVITVLLVTWYFPGQAEKAIPNGFQEGGAYVTWFYGTDPLPQSILTTPIAYCIELLAISIGSLLSGGLIGIWILVRAVNLAAFQAGWLLVEIGALWAIPATLPWWTLLRLAGYALLITIVMQPLWTGKWKTWHDFSTLRKHRRVLQISAICIILGFVLEIVLPGAWRSLFSFVK